MNELRIPLAASATIGSRVSMIGVENFPTVKAGDDLVTMILDALAMMDEALSSGDIVVVAQKIVSKAEGRAVQLSSVSPSDRAIELARVADKDPRVVELILRESTSVVRARPGLIVVEHRLGYVLANAGIDQSNIGIDDGCQRVLLLPFDPDATCRDLRAAFYERCGADVGVIVNDSLGRAWRNGTIGTALGVAGVPAVSDLRGVVDLFGRTLESTKVGTADELAAAASVVQGQASEGRPVVVIRGFAGAGENGDGRDLIRPIDEDLFR